MNLSMYLLTKTLKNVAYLIKCIYLIVDIMGRLLMPNRAAKQRKMDRRKANDAIKKRKRAIKLAKKAARKENNESSY